MENTTKDFSAGQRVRLHPATDLWMRGARYGTVVQVFRTRIKVELDAGRIVRLSPRDVGEIISA